MLEFTGKNIRQNICLYYIILLTIPPNRYLCIIITLTQNQTNPHGNYFEGKNELKVNYLPNVNVSINHSGKITFNRQRLIEYGHK